MKFAGSWEHDILVVFLVRLVAGRIELQARQEVRRRQTKMDAVEKTWGDGGEGYPTSHWQSSSEAMKPQHDAYFHKRKSQRGLS